MSQRNLYDTAGVPLPTAAVALKRFRAALATSGATRLNWWALGDSITEGNRASSVDTTYVQILRKALQKYQTPLGKGGFGYLATYNRIALGASGSFNGNGAGSGINYWTFGGGGSAATGVEPSLCGGRVYQPAANETETLTFYGTSTMIHFKQASTHSFTAVVDGGSPTTVSTVTTGWQGTWSTGVLTEGTHTVLLTPASGQTLAIAGASIFDTDESVGIECVQMGQYGASSTGYSTGVAATTNLTDASVVWPNPALVTINIGTNDPTNSITSATTLTNIQTIISNVKSLCTINPTFVLIGMSAQGSLTLSNWSAYTASFKTVAAADPTNVAVFDLQEHWIDLPVSGNSYNRGLYYSDGVHPVDAGYRSLASLLLKFAAGDLAPVN